MTDNVSALPDRRATQEVPGNRSDAPLPAVAKPGVDLIAVAQQAAQIQTLGKTLIASGLLPDGIKKPEAAVAVMLKGSELGIGPMYALSHIAIIGGKPTLSAELMRALVQRAGHKVRVVELTEERCTVEGERADDRGQPQRVTFTMTDARRANLAGKQVWKQYPKAMLLGRATSALCRQVFADVLAGCSYVPEELGAEVDEEGQVLQTNPQSAYQKSEVGVEGETPIEAEVVEEESDNTPSEDHAGVLEEVESLIQRFSYDYEADWRALRHYARGSWEQAVATKKRLSRKLNELERQGEAPIGGDQYEYLVGLLDELYEEMSDILDGHEWFEQARLAKPLSELTQSEAAQLIKEQDAEFKRRQEEAASAQADSVEDAPQPDEVPGVERGGATDKGQMPATKKQLNYLEALVEDAVEDGVARFEEMTGKAIGELTREEASEWISRLAGRAS